MIELNRYSLIKEKMPREFLLLQGTGCRHHKCTFCDYHLDKSSEPFAVNQPILSQVTGKYGVLDVINSGSCFELDCKTIDLLKQVVQDRKIHTLWFEAHWMYHKKLEEFAQQFPHTQVKFRTGVETFDVQVRNDWNKGIPVTVTPEDVASYFQGICLLFGVQGQSKESISKDIEIALKYFEYFSINAFVENTTDLKRDDDLVKWFQDEWVEKLSQYEKVEILIQNTDLGVG